MFVKVQKKNPIKNSILIKSAEAVLTLLSQNYNFLILGKVVKKIYKICMRVLLFFLFIKINGLLQKLIDAGVIGEVIHIQHLEPVSRQIR